METRIHHQRLPITLRVASLLGSGINGNSLQWWEQCYIQSSLPYQEVELMETPKLSLIALVTVLSLPYQEVELMETPNMKQFQRGLQTLSLPYQEVELMETKFHHFCTSEELHSLSLPYQEVELMETTRENEVGQHFSVLVASLLGSGINGNNVAFVSVAAFAVVASLLGSGINGNSVQVFFACFTIDKAVASLLGSGINGNNEFLNGIKHCVFSLSLPYQEVELMETSSKSFQASASSFCSRFLIRKWN